MQGRNWQYVHAQWQCERAGMCRGHILVRARVERAVVGGKRGRAKIGKITSMLRRRTSTCDDATKEGLCRRREADGLRRHRPLGEVVVAHGVEAHGDVGQALEEGARGRWPGGHGEAALAA